ncbi:hypothetical protein PAECIP111893_04241 [Paenibacillus plantiphilus]|uniref:MurNAc-LAA domain-containing protein n=1 Tax=Paenibacillus plantiphilus TaxID=2905650 RepID=A0ABN8GUP9_9BACL|nr:N-acetylmuramoyl-L-alanine amidase family protein [Paenibacillus plantiphilus]CAH1217245.1 hypothetical protein PAECIP111893_04241 [Paenibacillus plantiphilus]
MKKVGFLLLFVILLFLSPQYGQAASGGNTRILLDGVQLSLPDKVEVEIINSSVMVPIRVIVENLGFDVNWDKQTRKVTITKEDTIVELAIGSKAAIVDGTEQLLIAAPVIHSDTSLVPLRFISETMGLKVVWDNQTKEVAIASPIVAPPVIEQEPEPPAAEFPDTTETPSETTLPDGSTNPSHARLATVDGIGFDSNRLMIAITGSTVPNVFTMSDPNRIVIDIPNAKFADTFGNGQLLGTSPTGQLEVKDYPDVKGVRYSLFSNSPSKVRIVIDLNVVKSYTVYNEGEHGAALFIVDLSAPDPASVPVVPPVPIESNGRKLIVLDAGHGGTDPGTTGISGKLEKHFNLALTLKVEALLRQIPGVDVVLTRSDDTFIPLGDRAVIANNLQAALFISLHGNSVLSSPTVRGTETLYYNDSSKPLANILHRHLLAAAGFKDRTVKYKSLKVLRDATMPAALLEIGFLSNAEEESIMHTEEFQNRVASAIVTGIKEYLGLP